MLRVREALAATQTIAIPEHPLPVEETVSAERELHLQKPGAVRREAIAALPAPARLLVSVATDGLRRQLADASVPLPANGEWIYFDIDERGSGVLTASAPQFLYALFVLFVEDLIDLPLAEVRRRLVRVRFSA